MRLYPNNEKALENYHKVLPHNHADLDIFYNNIGSVCNNMKEYPNSLLFMINTPEFREKNLPSNPLLVDAFYHNINPMHGSTGQYSKTSSIYECALKYFLKFTTFRSSQYLNCSREYRSVKTQNIKYF